MNYEEDNEVRELTELQMQMIEEIGTFIYRAAGQSYEDAIRENYEQASSQRGNFQHEKIFPAEKELKELEKQLSPLDFENSRRSDREQKLRNGIQYSGIFDFKKRAEYKRELKELLSTPEHDTSALEKAIEEKKALLRGYYKESNTMESRINKLANEYKRIIQEQREKQIFNHSFKPSRRG